MPGYVIVERSTLNLSRESGIIAHAEEIGFLDFLRELAGEDVPFPKFTELRLVGLEEVLFAARPNDAELALDFHRRSRLVTGLHETATVRSGLRRRFSIPAHSPRPVSPGVSVPAIRARVRYSLDELIFLCFVHEA